MLQFSLILERTPDCYKNKVLHLHAWQLICREALSGGLDNSQCPQAAKEVLAKFKTQCNGWLAEPEPEQRTDQEKRAF